MAKLENNHDQSSRHGGARKGSGRKKGSSSKRTREIADQAASDGITPLEVLLQIMRTSVEIGDHEKAMRAAKDAAPYIHPRLNSVEMSGRDGDPIDVTTSIKIVGV
jgi:hypothetical protein